MLIGYGAGAICPYLAMASLHDLVERKMFQNGLTTEQATGHKEGWEHFLPRLVALAEGRDPGPDPWAA